MSNKRNEKSRDETFSEVISTGICEELVDEDNPFLCQGKRIYGYDVFNLAEKASLEATIFLNITGELPSANQETLLRKLMILFANLGPRNTGSRAAMNAGIGRTNLNHVIPIGLMANSGSLDGSQSVLESCQFLTSHVSLNVSDMLNKLESASISPDQHEAMTNIVWPGFGTLAGDIDPFADQLLSFLSKVENQSPYLQWCKALQPKLNTKGVGILSSGVFSAAALDLGLDKKQALLLFQSISASAFGVYGLEKFGKPLTEMPFVAEENYEIK